MLGCVAAYIVAEQGIVIGDVELVGAAVRLDVVETLGIFAQARGSGGQAAAFTEVIHLTEAAGTRSHASAAARARAACGG